MTVITERWRKSPGSQRTAAVCRRGRLAGEHRVFVMPPSRNLRSGVQQLRQAFQIQDPSDEEALLTDARLAAASESAEAVKLLGFAEELLDQLPAALRKAVREAAAAHAHSHMSSTASSFLGGDVRFDSAPEELVEKGLMEEALIGADTLARRRVSAAPARAVRDSRSPPRPIQRRSPLRCRAGFGCDSP